MNLTLYDRLKDYTTVPEAVFADNLYLANTVADIPGCVVECGVWKGGMIAALGATLKRRCWLFDSFEGLPPPQPVDGPAAIQYAADVESPRYFDNCRTNVGYTIAAMVTARHKDYKIVPGWFHCTLPLAKFGEPIALLRLDCDWYEATYFCLQVLFEKVETGGIVIIDDYFAWDGCTRAVHHFLAERNGTERIRSMGDVCYLVKQ